MSIRRLSKQNWLRKTVIATIIILLTAAGALLLHNHINDQNSTRSAFNKSQYSINQASSIWVIVNKKRPLNPTNYAPSDLVMPDVPLRVPGNESMQLRSVAATALQQMFIAAKNGGINLMLSSGYRSFAYQTGLYNGYVKAQGQNVADQTSARPGYSEHQTGLAVDIEPASRKCEVEICFASTAEAKWLVANAYAYGFILRYPADKVQVTGYAYEPWHFRYVGTVLSDEMRAQNVKTLEDFFDIPGGSSY